MGKGEHRLEDERGKCGESARLTRVGSWEALIGVGIFRVFRKVVVTCHITF